VSLAATPAKSPQSETLTHYVRFVGGTAAVTKVEGLGITIAYTGTGIVTLTWLENPGRFINYSCDFQATTASGVKGYTCVAGVFNTTAYTLALNITNAADTLTDLAALQWANVAVVFARTGI